MAKLTIQTSQPADVIDRHIYGHFSEHLGRCIYGGLWVGEDSPIPNTRGIRNDVVAALREMGIPNLRWPGGCFADEYHWRDGIGPKETRKRMVNTHWGGVTENNHFGTHEFMDLCEQLGCEAYINGNVGSGTVQEMQEWVEYLSFDGESPMTELRRQNGREKPWRVKFFGVGNENWGCGGNMRPEYYADLYRRYNTYVRNFGGHKVFRIACGPSVDDYQWTEVLMREAARHMDGLSLHHYTLPNPDWNHKGPATGFDESAWLRTMDRALYMQELVERHSEIMDRYDPDGRVALIVDEWGCWFDVEPGTNPGFLYQQNSVRDALVAGVTLNIFNNHSRRVRMANLAQLVNVLQSVLLTEGTQMVRTPTYYVFQMYRGHQDAQALPFQLSASYMHGPEGRPLPRVHVSASRSAEGVLISLCNLDPNTAEPIHCDLDGGAYTKIAAQVLTGAAMDTHNTFESPDAVRPTPLQAKLTGNGFELTLPAHSVATVMLQ